MFVQKFLPLAMKQSAPSAGFDEHPEASPFLDQLFVDQFLICLQDRERIDSIIGRNISHGGQRITLVEYAVKNHMHNTVAQLTVNRLTIIPFTIHPVLQTALCDSGARQGFSLSQLI
jgi:hypothetical protein